MPSVHDTAYPRLKSSFSEKELNAIFTPTAEELALAHEIAQSTALRIGFLVLLKTFQRLGYFPPAHKVPRQVDLQERFTLRLIAQFPPRIRRRPMNNIKYVVLALPAAERQNR